MENVSMLTRPGIGQKYAYLAAALLVATLAPQLARATW